MHFRKYDGTSTQLLNKILFEMNTVLASPGSTASTPYHVASAPLKYAAETVSSVMSTPFVLQMVV